MMNKLIFIPVILIGLVLMYACTEDDFTPSEEPTSECFNFSPDELASVGTLHNQYCTEVVANNNFSDCGECREEIAQAFLNLDVDVSGLGISLEELVAMSVEMYESAIAYDFDIRNLEEHPFSEPAYNYIVNVTESILAIEEPESFSANMNDLIQQIQEDANLSCAEKELLTGSTHVAINSANLWAPQHLGGMGLLQDDNGGMSTERLWWKDALLSDYTSSAIYFARIGIAGVILGSSNPVSGTVILVGWGLTSALSSAMAGVLSNNTPE
jgi:hypothetical protein